MVAHRKATAQADDGTTKVASKVVDAQLYPSGVPETLPADVTLSDVIASMPKDVFKKDMLKATQSVLITVVSVLLSELLLVVSPWWFLPFSWAIAGTAATGLFVIGHDCGHLSFARRGFVNDIIGTIAMMPLLYPFEPWRIQHNLHHNNTNKLFVDNAWQPFQEKDYTEAGSVLRVIMRIVKGPLYFIASVGHQIKRHFFLSEFTEEQRPRVIVSLVAVYAFAGIALPLLYMHTGLWGVVKYWVIPFLGYHFWMSTFTMVHHTLPHIPFIHPDKWSDVQARLTLTVHCEYPKWIEFLTHHINVHVPHHVSTAIPSYNLRMAHEALKAKWGKYMHETRFTWALLKDITNTCHIYHEEECYVPFSAVEQPAKAQ